MKIIKVKRLSAARTQEHALEVENDNGVTLILKCASAAAAEKLEEALKGVVGFLTRCD